MPCQKEDRDLIDHLLGVEPFARHRVGRRHDLRRQIIRRRALPQSLPPAPPSARRSAPGSPAPSRSVARR